MHTIKCGPWEGTVAPECGGNFVSLKYMGQELLRSPERLEVLRGRPCLYGFPLILPANRTEDGIFTFEGRKYQLPINEAAFHNHIHGILRDVPFCILEQTEHSVKTVLENKGDHYPFSFKLFIEDTLSDKGWLRQMTLQNTDARTMPYTLGFHAAFREPAQLSVPISACYEVSDRYIPTGKLLPLTVLQQSYKEGMCPGGSRLSGFYTSCGSTAYIGNFAMTVSEQFDHWVLFSTGEGEFVCIEPQCGAVNGLNNGRHRVLPPGEKEVFTVKITAY